MKKIITFIIIILSGISIHAQKESHELKDFTGYVEGITPEQISEIAEILKQQQTLQAYVLPVFSTQVERITRVEASQENLNQWIEKINDDLSSDIEAVQSSINLVNNNLNSLQSSIKDIAISVAGNTKYDEGFQKGLEQRHNASIRLTNIYGILISALIAGSAVINIFLVRRKSP